MLLAMKEAYMKDTERDRVFKGFQFWNEISDFATSSPNSKYG